MADDEDELFYRIQGYEIIVGMLLNAPILREHWLERFDDMIEEVRKNNGHAAAIEVLRSVRGRVAALE